MAKPLERWYYYLGDRNTLESFKGATCKAVLRPDGRCVRGKNGNMLVCFNGIPVVVVARLLRRIENEKK